jgi:hypothetical protein
MGHAGRQHVVVRAVLPEDAPHALDIVARMPPVALRIEVAEPEHVLQAAMDRRRRAGDLAGHEGLAAAGALVVEQDPVGGVQPIGLPVVHRDPVGVELGHAVGRAGMEGRRLVLRDRPDLAVELAGRGLVEARRLVQAEDADGFQQAHHADAVGVRRVLRRLEADLDVGLGAEVVDLVRAGLGEDADQVGGIRQVAVVQEEAGVGDMRVHVEVIHARRVEGGGAALHAVHDIALRQQQLRQVGTVLARHAGDQGDAAGHAGLRFGRGGLPGGPTWRPAPIHRFGEQRTSP